MTFWYYISGRASPGYIYVYLKDAETDNNYFMWSLGGFDSGTQWNYASFGFYYERPYTILIKATSGANPSTIAVDDIMFKESQYCSVTPASAGPAVLPIPSTTRPMTTTKDPSAPTSDFDCDFEKDLCKYTNDLSQQLMWIRNQGATSSMDTGPNVDHTCVLFYINMTLNFEWSIQN